MTKNLFIAVVLSAITYLFFTSHIAELAAIGVFTGLFGIYAWCAVFERIDKKLDM
jgi:hypothetical protein